MNKLPLLIDFDGVISLNGSIAPDAGHFFRFLKRNEILSIILSNSTLKSSYDIKEFLAINKIDAEIPVITTVETAAEYLYMNYRSASIYCSDKVKHFFNRVKDEQKPEAVLIGDLEDRWSYDILNEILDKVLNGAELIAMQKNRYWVKDGKILLDAGSFIAALEYASSKKATIIGKPSEIYFRNALSKLGMNPDQKFLMIGDDVETDIIPVQKLGSKGILIYSGKTKYRFRDKMIKPDFEALNLSDVTKTLSKM